MRVKSVVLLGSILGLVLTAWADEVAKPATPAPVTTSSAQSSAASSAAPQSLIKTKTKSNQSND